jgi:3',5'-cyclic AMP phosphodiesterase CpdA
VKRIAHLSDFHFGRVDSRVVAPLVEAVWDIRPDLVVLSGDFVQRGVPAEFEQARGFIAQLPEPRLIVPGNHDLPYSNLLRRFTIGLRWYEQYITSDLEPFYQDDEIAVLGINTARKWPVRGGRINEAQMRHVEQRLAGLNPNLVRVLVTHHPFSLSESYHRRELVGRARIAMGRFAQSIDILLAGHMHVGHAGRTAVRYEIPGNAAIFVQAGTATSTRERGEPNSFNLLRIEGESVEVERHHWNGHQFLRASCECFPLDRTRPPQPQDPPEQAVEVVYPAPTSSPSSPYPAADRE